MGKLELAERLKSDLDAVQTNAQASTIGHAWLDVGRASAGKFGGIQGGMVREAVLSPEIDALALKLDGFPSDEQAVTAELWFGATGLRRAIQNVASGVWAQEAAYPEGTSFSDDAADFAEGAGDAVGEVWNKAKELPKAVAPVLWPVAVVAVALVVLVVLANRRAVPA